MADSRAHEAQDDGAPAQDDGAPAPSSASCSLPQHNLQSRAPNDTGRIDIEDIGEMVQGRIIKRLLGQASTDQSSDTSNSFDRRPSTSFVARPAFSQEAQISLGSPLTCVDISPAGTHAVIAGDKVFKTLEINGDKITEQYDLRSAIRNPSDGVSSGSITGNEPSRINHIRWSHGELDTTIITAATNGRIATYDLNRLNSGFEVGRITEHKRQVHKLAINPLRGNLLLTAGQDGTVRFFDIKVPQGRPAATFIRRALYAGNSEAMRDVKWSPIRGFEFACSTANGTIMHWDTRNTRAPLLKISAHDGACLSISWHPDGDHIVSGGLDHQCYVWDLSRDANKRQKPKYSFSTPAPVSIVSWRPPSWSGSAQALRASQVATMYNDENSLKIQNSTVNIWDIARPGLPFKEIITHETSPVGMQWQNTDILWTVSREGIFRQNDLAYAPKVIDRKSLSEFAVSPAVEVLIFLEERQQKPQRHQPPPFTPHEKPTHPRSRLSMTSQSPSGTQLQMSRSDSEEDTGGSFLGPKVRLKKKKKSPSRTRNATQPDLTVMKLEDSLRTGGQFTPGQTMSLVTMPHPMPRDLFVFLSESYLQALTDDIREAQMAGPDGLLMHVRVINILGRFEEAAKTAFQHRLAQSWHVLSLPIGIMLQRRAEFHRQQRLQRVADRKKEQEDRERKHLRNSQRLEHAHFLLDQTLTKTPRAGSIQEKKSGNTRASNIVKNLLHEEESTSTMTTPLARPVGDMEKTSHTRQPLLRLESDEFELPPSSLHAQSQQPVPITKLQPPTPAEDTITPRPSSPAGSPRRSPKRKASHSQHDTLDGGYDFYDLDALRRALPTPAINISSPMAKKAPLRLDMPPTLSENPERPAKVLRHDSNESFSMFSTSGDSPYKEVADSPPASTRHHHARDNGLGVSSDAIAKAGVLDEKHNGENSRPIMNRGDTAFKSQDSAHVATFGLQSTGLQSSDFDSSWDSGAHKSHMRSLGAGWDSMGSEEDELSTSLQSRHHNPYFGENALIPPRSIPVELEDTDDTDTDQHNSNISHHAHQHGDKKPNAHVPAMPEEDTGADANPNANISFEFPPTGTQTLHGTPIDESSPHILDIDYLPHASDPLFTIAPLDPHILVPRQIDYFSQFSALNASFLILAVGHHLLPGSLEEDRNAAILAQYHRRLETNKLFVLAALVRKFSYPAYPLVFSQGRAVMTGEVVYWCETEGCGGRLKKAGLRVGEPVTRCERCQEALEGCAVCGGHERPGLLVEGEEGERGKGRIWVMCQGCGHGGHEACLTAWHSSSFSDTSPEPESGVYDPSKLDPVESPEQPSVSDETPGPEWSTDTNVFSQTNEDTEQDTTLHPEGPELMDTSTVKDSLAEDDDGPEGMCPLPGCLHPCLPGSWRRTHMDDIAAAKSAALGRNVRSELDGRSVVSGAMGAGRSGRSSRRNSGDAGGRVGERGSERVGERVKVDAEEAVPSRAVDALRFGERDLYREMKEGERARDRERERRRSVKFMGVGRGE